MYNHHKRMIPKREDAYRTEFPGNYYSSSSVYSYSPTSTSECPEHGRSRRRTTLCLVTSVIFATIGVLCIAGIAAYLGIISKNISNNAGQYEESYLQANTSNKGEVSSEEDALLYNHGRSQEDSGFIDLTNSLSDTNTGLGPADEDLIEYGKGGSEIIADNSAKRKPAVVTKAPDIVHGMKMNVTKQGSNLSPIQISAKPVNVVVKSTSTVSSSNLGSTGNYNSRYNPVDMIPPPIRGNLDNSVTYFTEEATTARSTTKTPPRNLRNRHNRPPLTNSHSLVPSTTTQVASTTAEEHEDKGTKVEVVNKHGDDEIMTSTQSSSEPSNGGGTRVHMSPKDAKAQQTSNNAGATKASQDSNQNEFAKRHGLVDEDAPHHADDPQESTSHRNHNHQPNLPSFAKGEEVSSVKRQNVSSHQEQVKSKPQSQYGNPKEEFKQEYFVPITPIISSEGNEDSNSDLLNNHQMPLSFDRISPAFYDKNPWTPLLDRPNLDKRPRVDINKPSLPKRSTTTPAPVIVWNRDEVAHDDIRENSSPPSPSPPQNYYGYGHTGTSSDSSSGSQQNKHAKPTSGFVDNGSISHALNMSTSTPKTIYQRINEFTPDSDLNVNPTKGAVDPNSYEEETTGGFRPLAIPAYTMIIPHIPNSPRNNSHANSTKRNGPIDSDEVHEHDELAEDRNLNTSFKFDRMGVVESSDDFMVTEEKKLNVVNVSQKESDRHVNENNEHSVEDSEKTEDIKDEEYGENDDATGDNPTPTKIYKLDADNIDIVPDTLGLGAKDGTYLLETQDLKKSPHEYDTHSSSSSNEDTTPKEPDPIMKSTTDLIMNTLGSLNLIKSTPIVETEFELESKLRANLDLAPSASSEEKQEMGSDTTDSPLFPPVRSYVSVNLPLRPKPSPASLLEKNPAKQFRMDEDLTTTSSLQKVLSMMMKFDGEEESRKFSGDAVNVTKQNVNLLLAKVNATFSSTTIATGQNEQVVTPVPETDSSSMTVTTTHREQKSYNNRHSKIDEQFSPPTHIQHVPVPLIVTEPPSTMPSQDKPKTIKLSNVTINDQNSPVYKFVLRQGQSIEDLLKEIFQNYTDVQEETTIYPLSHYRPRPIMSHSSFPGPSLKSLEDSPSKTEQTTINGIAFTNVKINSHFEPISVTRIPSRHERTTFRSTSDPPIIQTATSIVVNEDEDDFRGCPQNTSFRCVTTGKCIPSYLRCNFIKECPDNSDEAGCTCADFLKANGNGRKLCDGVVDCADASDEYNNCEYCRQGQYICAGSRSCINRTQLCDSKRDCPNNDDENNCVKIGHTTESTELEEFKTIYNKNGQLLVRKRGVWGKLCVETFSSVVSHWQVDDLAKAVCKALTFSDYETVERIEDKTTNSSDPYYELFYGLSNNDTIESESEDSSETPRVGLGFKQTECKSKLVVNVTCKDLQCGLAPKSFTQTARIVGGANSMPGKWPWQAALYKNGEYQCGATLISSRWLLSAGHCFYNAQDDYWVARLGTLRRGATVLSPYEQVVRITHVFLHPQYQNVGFVNDVSLLRLEHEVNFTDYVRPICLPSRENKIRDGRMCTVVGWGQLFEVGRVFPDTLQEVQLPLISTAECRKRTLFLPLYKVTDQMFCAGFDRGGRDACLGDSGGPINCQETDGRWTLYGVTSNGYGCARANRPGIYTKVASYLDWIEEKMRLDNSVVFREKSKYCSGHRCLLGECLDRRQICNGIVDCIEDNGSDERGTNCTTHLGLIT